MGRSTVGRSINENSPSLSNLFQEARDQRAGPPHDPDAVAYPHALILARGMLAKEIKDPDRLVAVLGDFDARIARIEEALAKCKTFGDQLFALQPIIDDANFFGLDLRKNRKSKGPDNASLLKAYEEILPRVQAIFKRRSSQSHAQLADRLSIEFPFLKPEQAADATSEKPSWVACAVVGLPYDLSPSRVRNRLTVARKQRAGR